MAHEDMLLDDISLLDKFDEVEKLIYKILPLSYDEEATISLSKEYFWCPKHGYVTEYISAESNVTGGDKEYICQKCWWESLRNTCYLLTPKPHITDEQVKEHQNTIKEINDRYNTKEENIRHGNKETD